MIAIEPRPEPPKEASPLEALPQGWFNHGPEVLRLIEAAQPRTVVELGSWLGASGIAMARSVRRWGGTVTMIDTWSGDLDREGGSAADRQPMMIWSCARNVMAAGVQAHVRMIPATTTQAAQAWTEPIDFLYIDADHSYGGVFADLVNWVPFVRPGGLIVGDDFAHPLYPGVAQAWRDYAEAHELTLTCFQSTPPRPDGIQLVWARIPKGAR